MTEIIPVERENGRDTSLCRGEKGEEKRRNLPLLLRTHARVRERGKGSEREEEKGRKAREREREGRISPRDGTFRRERENPRRDGKIPIERRRREGERKR